MLLSLENEDKQRKTERGERRKKMIEKKKKGCRGAKQIRASESMSAERRMIHSHVGFNLSFFTVSLVFQYVATL